MKKYCDLHTHSTYSDGTFTPQQIIEEAERIGLEAVALCDHGTAAGLPDFLAAAKGRDILAVPGTEISSEYEGKELHILGLFIPEASFAKIEAFVNEMNERKDKSNVELIDMLNKNGYHINYAEIKASTPNGHVNRAHIAKALMEKGYVESIETAFETILSKKHGFYKPPKRVTAFEAIAFLGSVGAVPVLAHPFLNLSEEELRVFLKAAIPYGLAGMETNYSLYSAETEALAVKIAAEFGLKESGGSDFHGENKPDIKLGVGKGNLAIPASFATQWGRE